MPTLDSVHPPASDDLSLPIQHQIDLFRHLVVVGEICSRWRKVHQEKVGYGVGRVYAVARGSARPNQKLVEHGLRVAFDRLLFQLT